MSRIGEGLERNFPNRLETSVPKIFFFIMARGINKIEGRIVSL